RRCLPRSRLAQPAGVLVLLEHRKVRLDGRAEPPADAEGTCSSPSSSDVSRSFPTFLRDREALNRELLGRLSERERVDATPGLVNRGVTLVGTRIAGSDAVPR